MLHLTLTTQCCTRTPTRCSMQEAKQGGGGGATVYMDNVKMETDKEGRIKKPASDDEL